MFEARYAYVRSVFKNSGIEVVVGIEVSSDILAQDIKTTYASVRDALAPTVEPLISSDKWDDDAIAESIEKAIRRYFPGLSYFLEVGRGDLSEWVQVFEPHGHNGGIS